jgi:hypothetical protein
MVKDPKQCLSRFEKAQNDSYDYRELSREDDRFCLEKEGQWEDRVIRNMGGRPRYTFDKTNPLIEDIMAEIEGMDFGARVRPTGGGATKELAETYGGIIRYIENLSDVPVVLRNATRRQIRRGLDYIRLKTDWSDEDGFNQDIFVKGIQDSLNRVWLGYHEQQDGSDADEGWQVHAMPPEDFEKKYGRKCQSIGISNGTIGNGEAYKPELALYLEYLYKKPYQKTVALMSDGSKIEITKETEQALDELAQLGIAEVRRRTFTSYKVHSRFLDASDWLGKEMETVWCSIPIIPVYGNFEVTEGKLLWSGAVRGLMDFQRVINYAGSRDIEDGVLAPKPKLMMTKKQASDKETRAQLKNMNISADPVLFWTPDGEAPPPFMTGGPQPNAHLISVRQQAEQGMDTKAGVFSAQQGQNPRYQSGWAIEQMISKGDSKTTRWLNNTAIAYRRICMMLIKAIPKVYDTERTIRIMNNDGTDETVELNKDVIDMQTGKLIKINDLSQGQYDVVVDLDKAYKSRRHEAAERLIGIAAADPSLMIEAADIVYGALDIPGADDIKERKRLAMLKQGLIPDTQMTDEEKEYADQMIQAQQQQAAEQQQQMAPVTEAMIANYQSIIQERMQQMENERIKLAQAQEKIDADKQKQLDTVMLKLTEMEQQYAKQLDTEYQQNAEVINGMQ